MADSDSVALAWPFDLNFFRHAMEASGPAATERWKRLLRPHYDCWGLDTETARKSLLRVPFDEDMRARVEEIQPEVVSFHLGRPTNNLVGSLAILPSRTSADPQGEGSPASEYPGPRQSCGMSRRVRQRHCASRPAAHRRAGNPPMPAPNSEPNRGSTMGLNIC